MFPDNFVQLKSGKTPTPVATTTPIKLPAVNPTPVEPPVVTRAMGNPLPFLICCVIIF